MLKLVFGIVIGTIMLLPSIGVAKPVVLGPGSSQMVTVTGYNTPENTIEFIANNESYVIDDLFADSPEGTKLIASLEQLIQSKQKVDIDYAVVQPDDSKPYNCKVALLISSYGSPAIPNSNKVYYVFDNGKSYLKIDPLSDYMFAMINSNINLARSRIAKDAGTLNQLQEQTRTTQGAQAVSQPVNKFIVPEFKSPYDIPSKAVLQALLLNLIGVNTPVERGSVVFKEFKITNNYTQKFNDETVYILDAKALVDIYPLNFTTNTLESTPQQTNRPVQGEIPFLKRGSKWFTFNDFSKRWLELPSQ